MIDYHVSDILHFQLARGIVNSQIEIISVSGQHFCAFYMLLPW